MSSEQVRQYPVVKAYPYEHYVQVVGELQATQARRKLEQTLQVLPYSVLAAIQSHRPEVLFRVKLLVELHALQVVLLRQLVHPVMVLIQVTHFDDFKTYVPATQAVHADMLLHVVQAVRDTLHN